MKGNQAGLLAAAELVFDPQLPADPSQTQTWVRARGALPGWVVFPGLAGTRALGIENHDFLVRECGCGAYPT